MGTARVLCVVFVVWVLALVCVPLSHAASVNVTATVPLSPQWKEAVINNISAQVDASFTLSVMSIQLRGPANTPLVGCPVSVTTSNSSSPVEGVSNDQGELIITVPANTFIYLKRVVIACETWGETLTYIPYSE